MGGSVLCTLRRDGNGVFLLLVLSSANDFLVGVCFAVLVLL